MKKIPYLLLLSNLLVSPTKADNVLVMIGESGRVTERQLESAMQAAPFATQFPSMDEKDQAYIRGDMLLRLARAEALYQEALATGIDQSQLFQLEMGNFKTTLLAQRFLSRLRAQIDVPDKVEQQFKNRFVNNSDALTAARSAYVAEQFVRLKESTLETLRKNASVETFFKRLDQSPESDTLLASGEGIEIEYGDLLTDSMQSVTDKTLIIDKVNEWIDLTLMARNALAYGETVNEQLADYARNLSVRLLLAEKEKEWIPSEKILIDYFQQNPNIGYIPERRQIGQIVLETKEKAEVMRRRILAGESLFELAGHHSIDPHGRERSGDMGWLTEGSGAPEIENAIKDLKDNEVSKIVETSQGWHLITIVNRKPSERKNFAAIKDRVRQKFIADKIAEYLQQVTERYPLRWKIAEQGASMNPL